VCDGGVTAQKLHSSFFLGDLSNSRSPHGISVVLELQRQPDSEQACLETGQVVWPIPGSLFGPRKPMESVTRGLQTVTRGSGSPENSL